MLFKQEKNVFFEKFHHIAPNLIIFCYNAKSEYLHRRVKLKKAICVLMIIAMLVPFAFSGCQMIRGNGSEFCIHFLDYIKQKDYEAAYALIAPSLKNLESNTTPSDTKQISFQEFSDKYTSIFDAVGLTEMEYTTTNVANGTIISSVDYTLTYKTDLAGELTDNYTITAEYHGGWVVMWEPALIFPSMEWGDKLLTGVNYPARGEIFDADGNILAQNIFPLTVYCTPASMTDEEKTALKEAVLAIPEIAAKYPDEETIANVLDKRIFSKQSSANIASFYPDQVADDFVQRVLAVDGLGIDAKSALTTVDLRNYPYGSTLSHILGFASIIQKEEWKEIGDKDNEKYDPFYSKDSWLGYAGLELQYEKQLRGEKGSFAYIQGSNGANRKTLFNIPAKDGQDLHLTIKIDLQKRVEDVVEVVSYTGTVNGAVIVMNPTTGAVEAMYSWPDYDPNDFCRALIDDETWKAMDEDPETPMLNRCIQGLYAPGSTFKVLTGSLGIESGTINWQSEFPSTENIKWDIWYPSSSGGQFSDLGIEKVTRTQNSNRHTPMNLTNSIIDSDNIFFSWVALQMGWDSFLTGMENVGMKEAIPFDLPVRSAQMVKDDKTELTPTLLTMTGYGQGEILVTPLQMASYVSAFRNGGVVYEPYIVDSFWQEGEENHTDYIKVSEHESKIWKRICSEDTANKMAEAMVGVCKSKWDHGGTGKYLGVNSYVIAGKTGTAEVGADKERELAWFIGFRYSNPDGSPIAPEDERLVLVMLELNMNALPDDQYAMLKFWIAQVLLKDDVLTQDAVTDDIMG